MGNIKLIIEEKIKNLPVEIRKRMDGLEDLVRIIMSMGVVKDVDSLVNILIEKQMPKSDKDKNYYIFGLDEQGKNIVYDKKSFYQAFGEIYKNLDDERKKQFAEDLLIAIKEEKTDVPATILKFLALELSDKIKFNINGGNYSLTVCGFEIANVADEGKSDYFENCEDFSFLKVPEGLRGLGLGGIMLHCLLKDWYYKNKDNPKFMVCAYGVKSNNVIAQNLYKSFGAVFLDFNNNRITQEEYQALSGSSCMLFENETLKTIAEKSPKRFITFKEYSEKNYKGIYTQKKGKLK